MADKKHHTCTQPKRMPNPADVRALGSPYNGPIKQKIAEAHNKRMTEMRSK